MGDSAASAVIEVIGKPAVDKSKLERILGILRAAFERPAVITNAVDRNPVATFTLLDQLKQDPSRDASALAEIDSARQYVIGALKNSKWLSRAERFRWIGKNSACGSCGAESQLQPSAAKRRGQSRGIPSPNPH